MIEAIIALVHNPFIMAVGGLQMVGGVYSFSTGDWRLGIINCTVGVANSVLSTMRG
jgi:hypothetical protein